MSFIGDKSVKVAIALVCAFAMIGAAPMVAVDPLFGIRFDPSLVHFANAPPQLVKSCPNLLTMRWGREIFLFGRSASAEHDAFVIGGYFSNRRNKALSTDELGALVVLGDGKCVLVGPAKESLAYAEGVLSTEEYQALANDAARRYREAFGGTAPVSMALSQTTGFCHARIPEVLHRAFLRELIFANAKCKGGG